MNNWLLLEINGWAGNAWLDEVMLLAAQWLIYPVFGALAVLVVLRLLRRELVPVLCAGATLAVAFVLGLVAAALHPEKRPFQSHHLRLLFHHAPGQSFPSDHATAAFAVAVAVLVFLSWRWGVALLATAVLIGFARVYAGIHYPDDILGSAVIAVVAMLLVGIGNQLARRPGLADGDTGTRANRRQQAVTASEAAPTMGEDDRGSHGQATHAVADDAHVD